MVKNSKPPHLVLDTTVTGLSSETVKSLTAALGLPTITASYGQERDLVKWRNIDEDEQKYLIQLNPPTDVIPEIIRDIVGRQNITNAAIMYDSYFGETSVCIVNLFITLKNISYFISFTV